MSRINFTVSALALLAATATIANARDQVQIAGSSTVLPYATIVAEAFGENFNFPTPVVQSGGSSAGLKKFCAGVGENTIDIANASRKIKNSEIEACAAAGVTGIIEVQFGYDGIVFASGINGNSFAFTPKDWYKALAAKVVVDGALVPNTATMWNEVNPDLPAQEIMAFVPGTKHGTREVFDIKVIEQGCKDSGAEETLAKMKDVDVAKACTNLRTDGRAIDIDGDYTETLTRIENNPDGIGVFGLSFYENNTASLQVATMNGVTPSTNTVASAEYPVSRPLYFYIKKAHIGVIPGLKEYAEFFVSDEIAGPTGPLAEYGLVSDPELAATQAKVANEALMN
ncbi:substrate-binding domain-containing protein [Aquicoccus sp. G2-2]|uniref:substrate-binding domain-containing protein n=1 Tax=Aquicoccus sp. G2-2 TaxID=3092120 RepID=UPI002AE06F00|nr:substrate-binding domain-containing protein [Aquicoccus sp. G2-2]MEA1114004.1 substrate-binding domain-containing protein [Aquicoccus sp. G2-2]